MNLNIRDIKILIYLLNKDKTTVLKSVQEHTFQKELLKDPSNQQLGVSKASIRRSLKKLKELGYISVGISFRNTKSYYITLLGINYINQICNER